MNPLAAMLHEQARAAVAAKRDDALGLFDALVAYLRAEISAPAAPEQPRRLATKNELMIVLGIKSPRTVEAMVRQGQIPPEAIVRAGRLIRFDLARVIEALRAPSTISRGAAWARRRSSLRSIQGGQ